MAIPYINEYVSSRTIKVSKLAIEKPSLDFLFSLSDKSKEKMLQDARLALLGKYSFQNKTSEYTTVKEGDLAETWNSGHYILRKTKFDSNTHAFQAHSLFLLSDLIYAYNTTENKQYLTKGIELFISWYENNPRYNLLPSHYSWGDHTVANRLINVVSFFSYLQDEPAFLNSPELVAKFDSFVSAHISFLLSKHNYSFKNNHGIFQDVALLYALQSVAGNDKMTNFVSKRLLTQVQSTYSSNGFHLENSPGYHIFITKLIESAFAFNLKSNQFISEVKSYIAKANSFKYLLVDNSGIIAPIGDTAYPVALPKVEKSSKLYSFVNDDVAGYTIYKSDHFYFFAKSTGVFKTHSHVDDGTFVMGYESGLIFSEVGFLDYTSSVQNKISKSRYSHNSLLIYDSKNKLIDNYCFVKKAVPSASNLYVSSICKDKHGLETLYSRDYIYDLNNGFTVSQKIISSRIKRWEQPLQLDRKINVSDMSASQDFEVQLLSDDVSVYLRATGDKFKVVKALNNYGYYAESFNALVPHSILLISGTEKAMSFNLSKRDNHLKIADKKSVDIFENEDRPAFSFRKETRPLQILFDLRFFLYITYLLVFIIFFYFVVYIQQNIPKLKMLLLPCYVCMVIVNALLQFYLVYRIFIL